MKTLRTRIVMGKKMQKQRSKDLYIQNIKQMLEIAKPSRTIKASEIVIRETDKHEAITAHVDLLKNRKRIVLTISKNIRAPRYVSIKPDYKKRGYLPFLYLSKEEYIIFTLAHELRHIWQHEKKRKGLLVYGAKGKYSERDADAYAIKKMRFYRSLERNKKEDNALILASQFFSMIDIDKKRFYTYTYKYNAPNVMTVYNSCI